MFANELRNIIGYLGIFLGNFGPPQVFGDLTKQLDLTGIFVRGTVF